MGKPVRTLKALARHEASLRRLCRTLAAELRAATDPVDHAALARIAVRLEVAGKPIEITRPAKQETRP